MNILLILQSKQISGISYYRQLMPHAYLKTLYHDTVVDQIQGADYDSVFHVGDEKLKEYQVVVLCREITHTGRGVEIIKRLQSLGIKVVLDVDDYWMLPSWHKLQRAYEHYKIPSMIVQNIKAADYVTTTTQSLADIISNFNDKVMVLPNCVDIGQPQFKIEEVPSDRMRFAWIGGTYHREDIAPLERSFEKLWKDKTLVGKWSLSIGGFNPNGEYKALEKIFTCDYKHLDYDYAMYLKEFTPMLDHYSNGKPYRRMWAKDAFNYIKMYNEIDVALVPLRDNLFNRCKSELKIVEAAAMGKAVIVSDTSPYNLICNSNNSIIVPNNAPHRLWYEAIKWCIKHPNDVKEMASNLTNDCSSKFNTDKITNERKQLYTWLIK